MPRYCICTFRFVEKKVFYCRVSHYQNTKDYCLHSYVPEQVNSQSDVLYVQSWTVHFVTWNPLFYLRTVWRTRGHKNIYWHNIYCLDSYSKFKPPLNYVNLTGGRGDSGSYFNTFSPSFLFSLFKGNLRLPPIASSEYAEKQFLFNVFAGEI